MNEQMPRGFHETSPDDEANMQKMLREAEGVLFADEVARRAGVDAEEELSQMEVVGEAEKILKKEEGEELDVIEREFYAIFENPEYVRDMLNVFKERLGWPESRSRAMIGVLRHALDEHYYRLGDFKAPDENNPHPEDRVRDTRSILLGIIERDYGPELAKAAAPLVAIYVERGKQVLKDLKGRGSI